jgi:hypothetical protein
MYILDFLFYYTAIHSENISKYRAKPIEKSEGARTMVFFSTFIWMMYIFFLGNYILFGDLLYLKIPGYYILIFSIIWHQFLTFLYIKKKRYQMIFDREHSQQSTFKVSDKTGTTIACVYIYSGIIGIVLGGIVWHFIVYGLPWQ